MGKTGAPKKKGGVASGSPEKNQPPKPRGGLWKGGFRRFLSPFGKKKKATNHCVIIEGLTHNVWTACMIRRNTSDEPAYWYDFQVMLTGENADEARETYNVDGVLPRLSRDGQNETMTHQGYAFMQIVRINRGGEDTAEARIAWGENIVQVSTKTSFKHNHYMRMSA